MVPGLPCGALGVQRAVVRHLMLQTTHGESFATAATANSRHHARTGKSPRSEVPLLFRFGSQEPAFEGEAHDVAPAVEAKFRLGASDVPLDGLGP